MAEATAGRSGWWGKLVALILGVPPIAVRAAEREGVDDADEPGPFARRDPRAEG
ncbi:hypothetical protein H9651_09695 [Microbacterium sp. Sa4CUA7]|uniref:Uncharacterized protein n=1 Tax=Microbacterium pullorum TaxID=2762236 RepID=A0ABR8S356_9MICO|nr:hypothetical protein [Microbacterium pullorum]MBD7957909.1 hypothetical protein [Microbacterium pullorum]